MHPPPSTPRHPFHVPSSSRRTVARDDVPLSAERAMMDQIRSKLERAQRRLARNAPRTAPACLSEGYQKSPATGRGLVQEMPASASTQDDALSTPRLSTARHGPRVFSSRQSPVSSSYDAMQSFKHIQYKSKSKYSDAADPLNGGPPPMSTPYLVYSNPRAPLTGSSSTHSTSTSHRREKEEATVRTLALEAPPSALRSGLARPPNSRVRFEGHETKRRAWSGDKMERDRKETENSRRSHQMNDRTARHHQRHREKELEHSKARAKPSRPLSPMVAGTRGHRSTSVENPPSSAIKLSAYDEIVQAMPTSPRGRPRRSSIGNPPPKSDIQIAAFDNVIPPRRRSSQDKQPKPTESKQPNDSAVKVVVADTKPNQKADAHVVMESIPRIVAKTLPISVVSEPETPNSLVDQDNGDTSANETDDSYDYEFSDFDTDSEDVPSGYAISKAIVIERDVGPGFDEENRTGDEEVPSPLATEVSAVKDDKKEESQPVSRLTARDLALHALGRAGTCSLSDHGSPVPSTNGRDSLNPEPAVKRDTVVALSSTPAPMSYTPASSAFPSARALGRRAPATTGRTRGNRAPPPAASTSVSSYVRRSLARAPMDLKNHLPPSIGVLSDLSSGSSTFATNPSHFYDITWRSGEFAFSVQRVYTEENEYEFDDRNEEPQLFLRMLLNTERSTCKSFGNVRVGDVLIRVGDAYVSDLGLEGSGAVLTKFFAKLVGQTPIRLTFQRMSPSDWEGGVEL